MANKISIGEEAINPQMQQQMAGDISPQMVQQKLASTISEKEKLDYILKGIAQNTKSEFNSRIKNPDTIVKKIAQKRMEGRDYGIDNINDAYGGRFIVEDTKDIPKIKSLIEKASEIGLFNINKAQVVKNGNYHAFHFDIETPAGAKGELQIMTPQEELESVSNHPLRSVYGEKAPPEVETLKDMQSKMAAKMPNAKAHEKAMQIQQASKANNDKPIDPSLIAQILKT